MKYRGNPRQNVLGPIRRVRFTQSTLRQAIIREKKGTSHRVCRRTVRVTLSYVDLHCTVSGLKTISGASRQGTATAARRRSSAIGAVVHLVVRDSTDRREAKVIRTHAAPNGVCDNLINALKLMANQQKDGDCSVNMVVQGFSE